MKICAKIIAIIHSSQTSKHPRLPEVRTHKISHIKKKWRLHCHAGTRVNITRLQRK